MEFDKKMYRRLFEECIKEERIKKSQQSFKIRLFLEKAENSLLIAKHTKEIQPSKDQPKKLFWDYWAITISYYSTMQLIL
ncbi:hypothetical protein HYX01_01070 [Candidatus Woesearchaeota archaeon]|nr:hypothetical protein [Candidatus Woesearchaeota archaeon]